MFKLDVHFDCNLTHTYTQKKQTYNFVPLTMKVIVKNLKMINTYESTVS